MSDHIYRVLYCSKNFIEISALNGEISNILATARTNNSGLNITGALLYNSGYFAQVLEGPRTSVERTFERIQRDTRHSDVTVLEANEATGRDFPDWSMAHVRPPSGSDSQIITAALDDALEHPDQSSGRVMTLLRTLVIQDD